MLSITGLTKTYGTQVIFDDVTFTLMTGERVGLVGRNGSGKTTFLRLILGEEEADGGSITVPRNYRIGHLSQQINFESDTVLKEACLGLPKEEDGSDRTYRAESILLGLGFMQEDFDRHPLQMSSGYQIRLNLARLLLSEPDLLLLDEPTNYLDIVSIRWLTRFLKAWKREVILITHDRWFMDRITTHTMGIYRGKLRKVAGTTRKLYQQILDEEEQAEKTRMREEKQRKEVELFVSRFRAQARRASVVQSRIKALQKKQQVKKIVAEKNMDFDFPSAPFAGKWMAEIKDLQFSYTEEVPLIQGLSFAIGSRDRIGVIGKNGRGKTTLLALLAGRLSPTDGEIKWHQNLSVGYFGQSDVDRLLPEKTVEEEIALARPEADRRTVRNICGGMMFEGDKAAKKIGVLSGGEKNRVLLGKLLLTPTNLLLLDEPTNHLDQEAVDSLIEAIDGFEGAVLIATHSEMALEATATRLIIFDGGRAWLFEGSYEEFLEKGGWQDEEIVPRQQAPRLVQKQQRAEKKDLRRVRAELIAERSRSLSPLEARISDIEKAIIELEERIRDDNGALIRASQMGQGKSIAALSLSIHTARKKIEELFEELESVSGDHTLKAREFEARFEELGNNKHTGDPEGLKGSAGEARG